MLSRGRMSHEDEVDLVYGKVLRFPCMFLVDFSSSSVSKYVYRTLTD